MKTFGVKLNVLWSSNTTQARQSQADVAIKRNALKKAKYKIQDFVFLSILICSAKPNMLAMLIRNSKSKN